MSTLEEQTEVFFTKFVESLVAEKDVLRKAMCPSVSAINDGQVTPKTRNALLEALADLEKAAALFRWAAANAALNSQHAPPKVDSEVQLTVHSRGHNPLDYLEGHAMAVIDLTEDMRREETRGRVLDIRQHAKKLVEFAKCLDLPKKPRKKR